MVKLPRSTGEVAIWTCYQERNNVFWEWVSRIEHPGGTNVGMRRRNRRRVTSRSRLAICIWITLRVSALSEQVIPRGGTSHAVLLHLIILLQFKTGVCQSHLLAAWNVFSMAIFLFGRRAGQQRSTLPFAAALNLLHRHHVDLDVSVSREAFSRAESYPLSYPLSYQGFGWMVCTRCKIHFCDSPKMTSNWVASGVSKIARVFGEFDETFMECDGNVMDSGRNWWEW